MDYPDETEESPGTTPEVVQKDCGEAIVAPGTEPLETLHVVAPKTEEMGPDGP